jgi:hypothetical protein
MKTHSKRILAATVVALMLALIIPGALNAQQILTLKNGYSYRVVVLSQTNDTLKYKLVADPGMMYAIPVSSVQTIHNETSGRPMGDSALYLKKYQKGVTLAIVGGVVTAGGIGASLAMRNAWRNTSDANDVFNNLFLTPMTVLLTAAGVTMTIVGSVNAAKYKSKLKGLSIDLHSTPALTGVTVRYKF